MKTRENECEHCGGAIDKLVYHDAEDRVYCSGSCRKSAADARQGKLEADYEPNYDYSDGTDEGLVIAMIDARKLK